MADTMKYGPQTPEVEALLARVSTLTDAEVLVLDAVRDETLDAVQYALWEAAWGTLWDAVWGAAWGSAWYAALDEALAGGRGAVWVAALALAARHLITPTGFTQAHYDLLTGPFASVIGKVHPDDAELAVV